MDNSSKEQKLLLIVTGASRGFGRACALAFCQQQATAARRRRRRRTEQHDDDEDEEQQQVVARLHAVLVGRSLDGLQETAAQLLSVSSGGDASVVIVTHVVVADLGDLETLDESIDRILQQPKTTFLDGGGGVCDSNIDFDECVLINNAGSLGHIGCATTAPSLNDMRHTVDLNVTAALWLSVRVARWASERHQSLLKSCTIVNVSSLVAVQPFPTLAIYSAGKAARDAYHNSMAQDENKNDTERTTTSCAKIRILNYAPGPLEATEMTQKLREADDLHSSLKPNYQKTLVNVNDSAMALMRLLCSGEFDNGQHVDYYDLVPPSDSDANNDE